MLYKEKIVIFINKVKGSETKVETDKYQERVKYIGQIQMS